MSDVIALTGTRAYLGARMERLFFGRSARAVTILIVLVLLWRAVQSGDVALFLVGTFLLLFSLDIVRSFINQELGNDCKNASSARGPASLLSFELVRQLLPRSVVTAGDLFEAAAVTSRGTFMLQEMGIDPPAFVRKVRPSVEASVEVNAFLQDAARRLPALGEEVIDANVVLSLLFERLPACREALHAADLSTDDLQGILRWEAFHHRFRLQSAALTPESLRLTGNVGRSWVMGYTDALDWLTEEISTKPLACGEGNVVIHREAIESIHSVLSRSTLRNALILGKIGVGKRTLVRNAACVLRERERRHHLPFTRVLVLKTQQLLSGIENPDGFFLRAFERARHSGHFLIVLEDLAVFLRSASQPLRAVFLKFLQAKTIAVVGIAATQDYHTLVKTDPTLDSLFEKIAVDDASDEETMEVLMARQFAIAARHGVSVTYKAMRAILELSKRYLGARGGFPGQAIEVLEDVVVHAQSTGMKVVREEHVREIISVRGRVNVQRVTDTERERLLKLEEIMQRRVIGQDWAVRAVVSALKRARIDISERKRPVGTFLFLGPTGVGKTQTAKVLAQEYFGSVDAMIRLDMNEFSHENSMIGEESYLTQRIQDNPFSLILLDEIEKAHPKIQNVFLQILDEGMFTDARGVKTDFRNSIIIATSNAGALFIRDTVMGHPEIDRDAFKKSLLEQIMRDRTFTPEFLNRFDEVVLFMPLSRENAVKVGELMLREILDEVVRKRGIKVVLEADLVAALVERGYSVEFGARELRRTITDMIEDYLADTLLRRDVKRGETVTIRKQDLRW